MRTTLELDDDVVAAAKERAAAERRSLGSVVSELARRGLTRDAAAFSWSRSTPGSRTSRADVRSSC